MWSGRLIASYFPQCKDSVKPFNKKEQSDISYRVISNYKSEEPRKYGE